MPLRCRDVSNQGVSGRIRNSTRISRFVAAVEDRPAQVGLDVQNRICSVTFIRRQGFWDRAPEGGKHGGPKRRIWRKLHIGIHEETRKVRAVEVIISNVAEAPMQLELIEQIPPEQKIGFITVDGADTIAGAASRQ